MIKRLQSARSQYSQQQIKRSLIGYEKAKTNIASEKKDPYYDFETAHPSKIRHNSSFRRPYSARH